MKNRFMVVDVETTGNKVGTDKIIQIGAMLLEDGEIIERFSSFVNPNMKLSAFIKQFTGINDEMLKKAPTFELIAPMLLEMLEGAYFVAHNVPFDLSFLKAELENSGYEFDGCPILDTVELSRLLYPSLNSYKLNQLSSQFAIEHDQPHRADSDAEATAHLLVRLLKKLQELPSETVTTLLSFAPYLQSNLSALLKEMIEEKKQAKDSKEKDFEMYRGLALKQQHKTIIIENEQKRVNSEPISIIKELQKENPSFEIREGQIEMMETVTAAFQNHFHGLIEAGTGTGKTLGYLIPSLLHAKKTSGKVVVSTYTTHLQEQIMAHEIKVLEKVIPFPFQATVLKGRNHYLCLRKFEQALESFVGNNYDTILTKAQILIWLTETTSGDVEELNLPSGGKIFWEKVKCDSDSCNRNCPWFTKCFYLQMRKQAEKADLIITNHALLLSDVKKQFTLLPPYTELVIDEAHHLEDVASEHFGFRLDYFSVQTVLNQIGLSAGTELLKKVSEVAAEGNNDLTPKIKLIEEQYIEVKQMVDHLFRSIRSYALHKNAANKNEIGRISYRFQAIKEKGPLWKELKNHAFQTIDKLEDLSASKKMLIYEFEKLKNKRSPAQQLVIAELKSVVQSLEEIANNMCKLLFEEQVNYVTWVEVEPKGAQNAAFLFSQPIDMSDILADCLFANKQSVILTSATLAIKDSFQYIKSSLGLFDLEVVTKQISSPFSYKEQVQLMIPTDMPEIKDVEQSEFISEIANKIIEIARVTKGRMLILFTAYDMLEKTYYAVKTLTELDSFVLIAQGISSGSRAKLTKNFKQHDEAILFGTSSFWEGIDVPGEDLSCIIIVRLPFSSPDNSMMAAKAERMKQAGQNAFMELYLPQAILRFKQGFGRLVRSQKDRGVVIVLDRRLTTKSYGKKFIHALPTLDIYEESTEQLIKRLADWLRI